MILFNSLIKINNHIISKLTRTRFCPIFVKWKLYIKVILNNSKYTRVIDFCLKTWMMGNVIR